MTALEVTYLPVTSLKPHPQNPRVHTDKQVHQIAKSIEAFGFNVPILVDDKQNVVAGHGRLLAARKLGWSTVPVIRLTHLTDSQYKAFLIADNKLTENGAWNERLLGEQLKVLSELELDFDLEVTGFEMAEIDLLIDGLETINEADPDDRLPEVQASAVCASGDLWQLGKHRVLCGNSLLPEDFERLLDGAKADLVITDPPYNVAIDGHATGLGKTRHREFAMASGEMSSGEFTEFLRKAMTLSRQSSQPGSLAYYFMDWRHMTQILAAGSSVYGELANVCVWAKSIWCEWDDGRRAMGGRREYSRRLHVSKRLLTNYSGSSPVSTRLLLGCLVAAQGLTPCSVVWPGTIFRILPGFQSRAMVRS